MHEISNLEGGGTHRVFVMGTADGEITGAAPVLLLMRKKKPEKSR